MTTRRGSHAPLGDSLSPTAAVLTYQRQLTSRSLEVLAVQKSFLFEQMRYYPSAFAMFWAPGPPPRPSPTRPLNPGSERNQGADAMGDVREIDFRYAPHIAHAYLHICIHFTQKMQERTISLADFRCAFNCRRTHTSHHKHMRQAAHREM